MPATLREVSEKLKLSPGLVSRVLNNRVGVRATPETVERIRQYAREMSYEPNAAAKSLRVGKTRVVAFVTLRTNELIVRLSNSQATEGLAEALHDIDYSLLVKVFETEEELSEALHLMVRQRLCDVVALWGDESSMGRQGELLERLGMPFVIKGRHEMHHPGWIQTDYDHEEMMAACVEHLAGLGHRRIAFIGFDPEQVFQKRLIEGYSSGMKRCFGRSAPEDWIASVSPGIESSEERLAAWLALPESAAPTAVVVGASNNPMWGIERALIRAGRKLGYRSEDFGAAGMITPGMPLLLGEAHGYPSTDILTLAEVQAKRQLLPLLENGSCAEPVVRILPKLQPLLSMNLMEVIVQS